MKPLFATPLILFVVWFALGTICPAHGQRGATVRESRIDVGGAELYAREVGKGPAIIVLHGGPDFDQSYLLPEMDRLSDSYRLIYYISADGGSQQAMSDPKMSHSPPTSRTSRRSDSLSISSRRRCWDIPGGR